MSRFTESELEAYLEEALAPADMAAMEAALREDPALLRRLAAINARRDAGIHTLGEMWRHHRLSCPSREKLVAFAAGTLPSDEAAYLTFHLETIGCRYCGANLEDLKRLQAEEQGDVRRRRDRYVKSAQGKLRKKP